MACSSPCCFRNLGSGPAIRRRKVDAARVHSRLFGVQAVRARVVRKVVLLPRRPASTTLTFMRRSLATRILGIAIAAVAAFASPAIAFAHGHAHHELLARSDAGHDHHHDAPATPGHHDEASYSTVAAIENSGDHDHPQISPAAIVRADVQPFVAARPTLSFTVWIVSTEKASLLLLVAAARASPPYLATIYSRPPPLLS